MDQVDHESMTFDMGGAVREVGGRIALGKGEPVQLRIFLDHSALEVRLAFCRSRSV